ncbi:MAG: RsmE family RNA methyltransferase [Rhodothermales bacterium]
MSKEKHRFYAPPESFSGQDVVLSEDESRHARKVLRVVVGDWITVVDGVGGTHRVRITEVGKKLVAGEVTSSTKDGGEPLRSMHIALGILHQPARWETFLEKAVELGCTRITPMVTARTQKVRLKRGRLQQIMISALKQSGRSRLPQLDEPTVFEDLLSSSPGIRLLCHESSPDAPTLPALLSQTEADQHLVILIGPEGGFTEDEVILASGAGWETVWLGSRRLRAETAALTVAAIVSQW